MHERQKAWLKHVWVTVTTEKSYKDHIKFKRIWTKFQYKDHSESMGISLICIYILYIYIYVRRQWDRLIFMMGFPILPIRHIYINTTLCALIKIKMSCYYRKSQYGNDTVVQSSYLINEISYTDMFTSLYWINLRSVRCQRSRFLLKR